MTARAARSPREGAARATAAAQERDGHGRPLVVAAVHAADGPQLTVVAACPEALAHRLAEYVRRKHETQLWPADAARVRALLDAGELDAAVAMYFERVGERWDEEWLVTAQIDPSDWTSDR